MTGTPALEVTRPEGSSWQNDHPPAAERHLQGEAFNETY